MVKSKTDHLLFIILYSIVFVAYLCIGWKYNLFINPELQNRNTLFIAYHSGSLIQFIFVQCYQILGGCLLAFYNGSNSLFKAWKKRDIAVKRKPYGMLSAFLPFMISSGLILDISNFAIPQNIILFLLNGFVRHFCAIATGYILFTGFELIQA